MTDLGLLRTITAGSITLRDFLYEANTALDLHVHDTVFIAFVLSGEYTSISRGTQTIYKSGMAVYHAAGHEHEVRFGSRDVRVMTVDVPEELMRRLAAAGAREPECLLADTGTMAWLCRRVHEHLAAPWAPSSALVIEGLVLEILGSLARLHDAGAAAEPRWLPRVEELVRAEFDRGLSVQRIAERVGVHPVHLSRTWRRFRGLSLADAMHRARIEEACRRIAAGSESLADLALAVGFADQTHFSRVFKRLTGTTPGAFRRSLSVDSANIPGDAALADCSPSEDRMQAEAAHVPDR
jgi:AraC family transcriptional regulator